MNRGNIKLTIDRCIAHDVPGAADMIESLCQQLISCQAALADTEALEIGTGERLAKVEQQLANALAACKLKDESLEAAHNGLRWWMDAFPLHVTEADNEEMLKIVKALTTQPDDAALKAWLGKAVCFYDGNTFYADERSAVLCMADMSNLRPLYATKGQK